MIEKIVKRDGRIVPFDKTKIAEAIWKAAQAVGGKDRQRAYELADKVVELLEKQLKPGQILTVEQVQDVVEKVLVESGHYRTAKAYILYRALHGQIRELVDRYLEGVPEIVRDNANSTFSLQGLNFNISSQVIAQYWLHKIFKPRPEIREAHINGDFHIHNLAILGAYCAGWDLRDLLVTGFRGVRGKIDCKPAKHFRSILGQVVNFLYTLQGETAGANALSNFDTYLAPFIRYDNLDYKAVKQALQEFMFNINVPTRVGFQCLSEDTEILTPSGWKSYKELNVGETIFTFNLTTQKLEVKPIKQIFARRYKGLMYNLCNRTQDQLVSPRHRVVRQVFNSTKYKLEPVENLLKFKSPIPIPVFVNNDCSDQPISDEELKIVAWILSEGSIENEGRHRVSIYQSPLAHPTNCDEIIDLPNHMGVDFKVMPQVVGWGTSARIRVSPSSSKILHKLLGDKKKVFPKFLFRLSQKQARLFLETYLKGDGWEEKYRKRIATTDRKILEGLEALAVLAGFNFVVRKRKPRGVAKKTQYVLTLTESKHDYIQSIKKVYYKGIIWSVHTDNETVIAKRNGQVFITGNTPFTNITLDLKVPEFMKDEPVIIGGNLMNETYGDFQDEMDIFNKVLAEVMLEGDASGRVLTFPIPTINVTKDFDWESEVTRKVFETSAKYGIPYFANFINSDMKPEDVRSMCLYPDEEILVRNDGEIHRMRIEDLVKKYAGLNLGKGWFASKKSVEVLSINPSFEVEWQPVKHFLRKKSKELVEIVTIEGKKVRATLRHPFVILTPQGLRIKFAKDVKVNDIILSLRSASNVLKKEYAEIFVLKGRKFKIIDEELINFHKLGFSDEQIASIADVHVDTIRKKRRKLKLKANSHLQTSKENLSKLKKEFRQKLYQREKLVLNEELAAFLGFFTADGNYLFENRKNLKTYGLPRGIQLTFNRKNKNLKEKMKRLICRIFGIKPSEKEDPRYHTSYLYVYDSAIARALYQAGFKKYRRLSSLLFNSPPSVIRSFLTHFFLGDGYEKRMEIHINDLELARDLVILYSLIGIPTCIKFGQHSQRIYLQHKRAKGLISPTFYELVPGWVAKSTYLVPGLKKRQMVSVRRLEKFSALTPLAKLLAFKGVAPVRIKSVRRIKLSSPIFFYDVELNSNHLFVHSLGTITHNCCRLRIDERELRKRGGGLFGAHPTTGSIGVVTINMPRLGYLSKSEDEFLERLDALMELAKKALEIKRSWLEKYTELGLYPYSKFYLRKIKEAFGGYWKNHFCTIGLIGMNEACLNLLGCTIGDEEGLKFAEKVLDFMRNKLMDFQLETQNIYNLEATPAEGTSYRLARIDKRKFPDIIVANEEEVKKGAEPFYTNSTHLPVNYTDDIWEYLRLQDPLQIKYTGGTVVHIWLGEAYPPVDSVINVVKKICESFRLPYFTLTPTFSICQSHGYLSGKHELCPKCEAEGKTTKCEVYSRIVGYLRPVDQWNPGKQEEFKLRKTFDRTAFH